MKKSVICFVLILAIVASLLTTVAAAEIAPGDTVRYTVSLQQPATLAGFKVFLDFDTSVFSLVSEDGEYKVEQGSFSSKGNLMANATSTGAQVLWYHTANVTASGSLFTLTLKVADDAASGTYPISVRYSPEDTVNVSGAEVPIACSSGSIVVTGNDSVEPGENAVISVSNGSVFEGDSLQVPVNIVGNSGFAGFSFVFGCPDGINLTAIQKGTLLKTSETGSFLADPNTNRVIWTDSEVTSGDGELLVLTLEAEDDCAAGEYPITVALVDGDPKNFVDINSDPLGITLIAGTLTVTDYILGDMDGDENITATDMMYILRHIVGSETLNEKGLKAADIDKDGKITAADCVRLARYLVDLIPNL